MSLTEGRPCRNGTTPVPGFLTKVQGSGEMQVHKQTETSKWVCERAVMTVRPRILIAEVCSPELQRSTKSDLAEEQMAIYDGATLLSIVSTSVVPWVRK